MKIKLEQIVLNVEQLKALQEVKFPVKVSYRIMRLVNKLQPELNTYETKRNELVKEFGEPADEKGDIRVTDPKKLVKFTEKLQELLSLDIEVDFTPIKMEELGDVNVEPKLLINFIFE
jgi:hypothetical protein